MVVIKSLLLIVVLVLVAVFAAFVWTQFNWHPLPRSAHANRILVEKSARRLVLYDSADHVLKTYRVALGRSPIGTKHEEGDCRTPEGIYLIDARNEKSDFHRALHISYPDANDLASAERRGLSAGGDIMIHGLPNGRGWMGAWHRRRDWTAGCIAVTDKEIEEIWRVVDEGTPIEIRP